MIYIILIALVVLAIIKISKQKKRDSRSKQLRKMGINEESIEKAIIMSDMSESDLDDYYKNKHVRRIDDSMPDWIKHERSVSRMGVLESLINDATYKDYFIEFSTKTNLYDEEGTTKSLMAYRIEASRIINNWLDELYKKKK